MTDETKPFQCRHIFADGHRCGSKCLRGEPFCYYHHTTRKPIPRAQLFDSSFTLPRPENRAAIQSAIGLVIERVAAGSLDARRAGLILYALQIAAANMPKPQAQPKDDKVTLIDEPVQEIVEDETLGTVAPILSFEDRPREPTLLEHVMHRWSLEAAGESSDPSPTPGCPLHRALISRDERDPAEANSSPSDSNILPSLQAAASVRIRVNPSIRVVCFEPSAHPATSPRRRKARHLWRAFRELCRRSPNLPHTYACSTIGPTRLNFRVRDGNGCDPRGKLTGKL